MKYMFSMLLIGLVTFVLGQQQLPLDDMSGFQRQAGNWFVVGDVHMDPMKDIHDFPVSRKPTRNEAALPAVTFEKGTGILLNVNDERRKDHLLTVWEHGDVILELEVMIPKGSNSGIYLQGRYEVQLLDSWGVKRPGFGDIGGIYRNWEQTPGQILKGIPPMVNAAKAPGTWQQLRIVFQAPRFDQAGNKTANARFVSVVLNGIEIHNNVEVELPTGGPISKQEVARGPLMIQGDHGPVAFRNIRYSEPEDDQISMSNLRYKVYKGRFRLFEDFESNAPESEGVREKIDVNVVGAEDQYGLIYTGDLTVGKATEYVFRMGFTGGLRVQVNDRILYDNPSTSDWQRPEVSMMLEKGVHKVTLWNFKNAGWRPGRLELGVKGTALSYTELHSLSSYPEVGDTRDPIYLDANEWTLHRGFTFFQNDEPKLSHTIAVGSPDGVHYIYDLGTSNLIAAWRGDFLDATPMWWSRGDGSFRARGSVQWTFLGQPLCTLSEADAPFPIQAEEDFRPRGYVVNEQGMPAFLSDYAGRNVTTSIIVDSLDRFLIQEIRIEGAVEGLSYKLAEGMRIKQLPNGYYSINDNTYFIEVLSSDPARIRNVDGKEELVIDLSSQIIRFSIIW